MLSFVKLSNKIILKDIKKVFIILHVLLYFQINDKNILPGEYSDYTADGNICDAQVYIYIHS